MSLDDDAQQRFARLGAAYARTVDESSAVGDDTLRARLAVHYAQELLSVPTPDRATALGIMFRACKRKLESALRTTVVVRRTGRE